MGIGIATTEQNIESLISDVEQLTTDLHTSQEELLAGVSRNLRKQMEFAIVDPWAYAKLYQQEWNKVHNVV